MKRLIAMLLGGIALPVMAATTAETTLDNGLKVVVREDHRAPVAVVQVWYRAGSIDEHDGKTGLAHVLEHMMFKGTAKVPAGEFSRIVSRFGGEDNAFTTDDYTGYYQIYAADRLPLALELEADRLSGLVLDEEGFRQELRVVMEERRWRTDDNPQSVALERFEAMAHVASPYRRPVVGWMKDLEGLTLQDVKDWYARWYVPNNAVLVVVGDVKADEVIDQAKHYFGSLQSRPLPESIKPTELSLPGERRLTLRIPAKVPALYVGFNVPGLRSATDPKEAYALRMLAGVLDEGVSARLETRVVREQQVAAAVGSAYGLFGRGDTLMTLTAVPAPGKSLDDVEKALLAEVRALAETPPTVEEVARVHAQLISSDTYHKDSVAALASSIGRLESVGLSWKLADEYADRLREVTPEEIQAVARKYLVPDRMSVARLEPQP